jgi:hypothetical protein
MSEQSCKTCRHLDVALNAAGRRIVRAGNVYPCVIPVVPQKLPDSVTEYYAYFPAGTRRRLMTGAEGKNCPTWAALGTKEKTNGGR